MSYAYDSRGNRIKTVNALNETVQEQAYNLQDLPRTQTDAYGNRTDFDYEADGQLKEVRHGNSIRRNRQRTLQKFEYNAEGQIVGITDGNQNQISYDVDGWGRITSVGSADGVKEGYGYTPAGQISRTVDGNGNIIQYRYNSLGKVSERTDQLGYKETYQYDKEGNLALHTDRDGRRLQRVCNVFGDPVYEKATDADGKDTCISTWHYDSIGRIVRAVSDGHSYEYIYDEYGNLKEKRSNGKRLVSYTHDAAGQITEIKDPAGIVTKYEYDIMGRQSRVYNDSGLEVRYNYDALNRISHIRYGNGVETAYAYDTDGNISSMETKAGETVLLSFAYEYDGNGNRTIKTGMQMTAGSGALDISYDYDVRGQLLEERRNGASVWYVYDKAGNRIKKTDARGEIRYFYNEKNQILCTKDASGEKRFTYDKQGGIVEERNASAVRHFTYDSRHRQTKVETEEGSIQENRYDVENLRFELLENGKRTRFVYHDSELLYEEGGKENRQTGYHLGAGIEAFSRGQDIYYYQQDEQLSTAFITGRNGKIYNSYQYDAFGNGLDTAGDFFNRIRYTGQQYDDATGQYYLRARFYNPILGRFMQEDTYQGDGLNLYAYCKNNPVTYYDPSGYDGTDSQNNTLDRTPLAQEECKKVVDVGNAIKGYTYGTLGQEKLTESQGANPATSVIVHEDGTVSVGISGKASGTSRNNKFAQNLENALNESVGYNKYSVSAITDPELLRKIPSAVGKGNKPGYCAEPKAATAAHYNKSNAIGMDTRYFNTEDNSYSYNGTNQMKPCDTCEEYMEEYVCYANNK